MAVRALQRSVFATCIAALLAALVASSACAQSTWWHMSSATAPANLPSGTARDQVYEIQATGGPFVLVEDIEGAPQFQRYAVLQYNETAQQVQEQLETELFPGRKLSVSGGPTPSGVDKYTITFPGQSAELGLFAAEATLTKLSSGRSDGKVYITAANLGYTSVNGEKTALTLADTLPKGMEGVAIEGVAEDREELAGYTRGPVSCSIKSLSCTFTGSIPPYDQLEAVVSVVAQPGSSGENEASVFGGEEAGAGAAAAGASIKRPLKMSGEPTPFGADDYEMAAERADGTLDTQAGSHPFQLTTTLDLNRAADGGPVALAKDLHFKLPPGLIGNPVPFPQCTLAQFLNTAEGAVDECTPQTAVGVASVTIEEPVNLKLATVLVPLFNLEPEIGEPARFGFYVLRSAVLLDTSVRTGGDYSVSVDVHNITQNAGFIGNTVTFWGVPGDPRHNPERGWDCLAETENLEFQAQGHCHTPEASNHPPPLLVMPTSCTGPLQTSVAMDSWADPGSSATYPGERMPALDGCNRLPFSPSISVTPDGTAGDSPTGLTVAEHVPQSASLNPEGLAEAHVRDTKVTLPAGVAINPAGADGLLSCSEAQIALSAGGPPTCPEASKIGTVEVKTPLLPNPLTGAAYLAAQNQNPFGSLVAMYLFVEDPISGSIIKVAGEVKPDPVTGQLVSTFDDTPQLPFEDLKLHFFGGSRAPLSTPSLCGDYTTTSSIAPWSGNTPTESTSTFAITSGPNGSPCASPLPFAPTLTAETTSIQAGGFSPFSMTMSRADGNQNLNSIKLRMPPGLLGTLSSVKLCGEPQADAGTCGPESLIGHTVVSVGVGGNPFSVTGGEVFITGPYRGAPYGLSIVNPAKAGPFDLGKVVVRAKVEVDQETAALTITTDETGPYKIPTIIDGIPLQIQHVNVQIDRPQFTFNPTNCNPLAITGSLTSSEGASAALSVPFQITNCAVLAFKPKLQASVSGRTSRANGAAFHVKLGYPAGPFDANIAKVKVELPKAMPSRLSTLQKACVAKVFEANPAGCPAASIVGHATASTPVLPVPLSGPAYFVSHGGEAFPSLIIVLQGYGTTVHLVGATFIDKTTGVTSSTFKTVPDVPVGTFELTLPQGPFSALTANTNLCKAKLAMPTEFVGQNGALIKTNTKIAATGCGKAKRAHHKKKRKAAQRRRGKRR